MRRRLTEIPRLEIHEVDLPGLLRNDRLPSGKGASARRIVGITGVACRNGMVAGSQRVRTGTRSTAAHQRDGGTVIRTIDHKLDGAGRTRTRIALRIDGDVIEIVGIRIRAIAAELDATVVIGTEVGCATQLDRAVDA